MLDEIIDSYYAEIEAAISRLESLVTAYVGSIPEGAMIDPVLAQAEMQALVQQSGYYDSIELLMNEGYQDIIDDAFEANIGVVGEGALFTDEGLRELTMMKNMDLLKFNQLADDFVVDLNRGITSVSMGQVSKPQLVGQLRESLAPKLKQYAETWTRTGMSSNYRNATMKMAEAMGIKKFRYEGAISQNTRPFCLQHIGEIRTQAEWDSMDNGKSQPGPVSIYGGGYNCQHRLRAVK